MHKSLVFVVVASVALTSACKGGDDAQGGTAAAGAGQSSAGRAGARGARPPMPVEFAVAKRAPVSEQILIVGNLIGAATVQVVPRVNGRLASVAVKLGDSVRRGQTIAKAGNTGAVDRPQLHFELRQDSKPVDPLPHMEKQ